MMMNMDMDLEKKEKNMKKMKAMTLLLLKLFFSKGSPFPSPDPSPSLSPLFLSNFPLMQEAGEREVSEGGGSHWPWRPPPLRGPPGAVTSGQSHNPSWLATEQDKEQE